MTELRPYQRIGVKWLHAFEGRGLLADEMGLGKTIQSLQYMVEAGVYPTVVVAPASVKYNWEREIAVHFRMGSEVLDGTRPPPYRLLNPHQIYIVNFDILPYWLPFLKRLQPQLVIVDEVQRISNPSNQCSRAVRELVEGVPKLVGLSGSPFMNRPAELWNFLNLLRPDIWPDFHSFAWAHCSPRLVSGKWQYKGAARLDVLHAQLKEHCMIRRLKQHVLKDLPPKMRIVKTMQLTNMKEYEDACKDFVGWVSRIYGKARAYRIEKAEQISRLTHLKGLVGQGKVKPMMDWISEALEGTDGKMIFFGVHKAFLRELYDKYKKTSVIVNGDVTARGRQQAFDQFTNSKRVRVLFGNLKAAGVGWNGQAASTVGMGELGWNPPTHVQAEDRAHRMGQKEKVTVYYHVAEGTIEETLWSMIQRKQNTQSSVLDGRSSTLEFDTFEELTKSLMRGAA